MLKLVYINLYKQLNRKKGTQKTFMNGVSWASCEWIQGKWKGCFVVNLNHIYDRFKHTKRRSWQSEYLDNPVTKDYVKVQ